MNNNIYILIIFALILIISNIVMYNIGLNDGKRIYKDTIKIKCAEGIKKAKSEGRYNGRQPKQLPENHTEVLSRWLNKKITAEQASKELGIAKTTLYRRFGDLKKKTV